MKLKVQFDAHDLMAPHVHGRHCKDLIVLHETVSHDAPGLSDIIGVERYLAAKDYGIHGCVDKEGNVGWARGLGDAVFWQCGGVNERSIGIEQVSYVMVDQKTNQAREKVWKARKTQLRATAKLVACISRAWKIPLVYSDGDHPGVTTHWSVSQHHPESEGHTDCWPLNVKPKGYYPALYIVFAARQYKRLGWRF